MSEEHTKDLRDIDAGDNVTLETSEGEKIDAECIDYRSHNAKDPDIIMEDNLWEFRTEDGNPVVAGITNGLKHREDMADFPRHKPLYDKDRDKSLGYIVEVEYQ